MVVEIVGFQEALGEYVGIRSAPPDFERERPKYELEST